MNAENVSSFKFQILRFEFSWVWKSRRKCIFLQNKRHNAGRCGNSALGRVFSVRLAIFNKHLRLEHAVIMRVTCPRKFHLSITIPGPGWDCLTAHGRCPARQPSSIIHSRTSYFSTYHPRTLAWGGGTLAVQGGKIISNSFYWFAFEIARFASQCFHVKSTREFSPMSIVRSKM